MKETHCKIPDPGTGNYEMLVLPLALAAGFALSGACGIFGIVNFLCGMVPHELGHALIFWLNSQLAVPSFAVTVPLQSQASVYTFCVFSAALAACAWFGAVKQHYVLLFGASIFGAALCAISACMPPEIVTQLMLYGGLGGEFYLGAGAMLLFHAEFPPRLNWSVNRWLFLVIGSFSYTGAANRWFAIKARLQALPMGGMLDISGAINGESNGDLDRLMREFGWTQDFIISTYVGTFWVTTILLIAAWLAIVWYKWMRR